MAILNVTPDSFSDGGTFASPDSALRHADQLISEGTDIIDIGGESTRPGSLSVSIEEEISRVVPVVAAITKRFDVPISVDTSKAAVASAVLDHGAEIINDMSGLRWDPGIADIAARQKAGLILMHSRGEFGSMHTQPPLDDILAEVSAGLQRSIAVAKERGVGDDQIVLDVGIGFGKSFEQNLELIAKLDKLVADFPQYSMLIGTSRKSFIGKILGEVPVDERLSGSLATAAIAVWKGARIVRVHDVRETVEMVRIIEAIKDQL
jgi:dihydropteroate synthase